MPEFNFNIGAKIHCKDGDCGELERIVYDPYTKEISDLIVSEGVLFKTERVLPVGVIERTAHEDIYLVIKRDQFQDFPEYREVDYEEVGDDTTGMRYSSVTPPVNRVSPYSVPEPRPLYPTIQRRSLDQNVGPGAQVLERGTDVVDKDRNKIGTLDHLLLDQETCEISYIVVDRGLFKDAKVIPESMLEAVSEDNIILRGSKEDLVNLPSYVPRGDEHILSEAQEYLNEKIKNEGLQIHIEKGVMQLTGYVQNAMQKRRAEAAARSIKGVVDVKNNLRTDTEIQAVVAAALHRDRRTELSLFEVESEFGIVTLRGVVDNQEIAEAAEKIVSLQPGVNMVVNELVVEHDEFTAVLQNRLGWEMEKMKGSSYFPG